MQPWKAMGPDGFPHGFFQSQWSTTKEDEVQMIQSFFASERML